jgi:hypothetical protein
MIEKGAKITLVKTLQKIQISAEIDAQINKCFKIPDLSKADIVRQALQIGLPQYIEKFRPPSRAFEGRIRQALAQAAKPVSATQFTKNMKAIVRGR